MQAPWGVGRGARKRMGSDAAPLTLRKSEWTVSDAVREYMNSPMVAFSEWLHMPGAADALEMPRNFFCWRHLLLKYGANQKSREMYHTVRQTRHP
jgi:hypothetical protein